MFSKKQSDIGMSLAQRCHFAACIVLDELCRFQANRAYVLRDFEYRGQGEVVFSAYAATDADQGLRLQFGRASVMSIWQESYFRDTMHWPLEIIKLHARTLSAGRFLFTLTCVDFEWTWESDWPQFV